MKVVTMPSPAGVRAIIWAWSGGIGWVMVSRRGTVRTALFVNGRPQRTKHWTARRDHRRRMERVAALRAKAETGDAR